ncbi:MAG: Na+/H+ antiporter NhaA [Acidimicrobiales bacterium]
MDPTPPPASSSDPPAAAPEPGPGRTVRGALAEFVHDETAGGVVLVVATVIGLLWANVATAGYASFWSHPINVDLGFADVHETYARFVNDGLMTIFFFVVGLEIKRELAVGELRDRRAAALPFVAALGGMAVPVLVFLAVTAGQGSVHRGWAIPIATDIAFVMGVVALLGRRVPAALRLFLLTLAIVDDIGGILVIAFVYTGDFSPIWLGEGVVLVVAIVVMQRLGVNRIWPYVLVGIPFWFTMLESGVHATIAGVVLGLLTPARPLDGRNVIEELEHRLHPISAFVVVPIFALANTGILLTRGRLDAAVGSALAWGVLLGLVVGKPVGIVGATWLARRLRIGGLPEGLAMRHVIGGGMLAGIGFTVALFITELSLGAWEQGDIAKLAILAASVVAAGLGATALLVGHRRAER